MTFLYSWSRLHCSSIVLYRPLFSRRTARSTRQICTGDGLRILFCGSDQFSVASLERLHEQSISNPHLIATIDVVNRPGKRVGRDLKNVRDGSSFPPSNWIVIIDALKVPIVNAARELGLPLHELTKDTFTRWNPPIRDGNPINLIIAVSFGLKVPERLINGARWGGLNVHPSLLPDLAGPAPLHHALLKGRTHIGITLQTLHPTKFDHGTILDQTLPPGLEIPNNGHCSVKEVADFIAPKAAVMLSEGLEKKLFLGKPNAVNLSTASLADAVGTCEPAPKITKQDSKIDWSSWSADRIVRTGRVLGRLWSSLSYKQAGGRLSKDRIIFQGLTDVTSRVWPSEQPAPLPKAGTMQVRMVQDELLLDIWTCDQRLVNVETVTMQGKDPKPGARGLPKSQHGRPCLAGAHLDTFLL